MDGAEVVLTFGGAAQGATTADKPDRLVSHGPARQGTARTHCMNNPGPLSLSRRRAQMIQAGRVAAVAIVSARTDTARATAASGRLP